MAEIVKCPFCGGVATVGGLVPWVECQSCGASGPQKTTDEEAIAAWNHRHSGGDGEDSARLDWLCSGRQKKVERTLSDGWYRVYQDMASIMDPEDWHAMTDQFYETTREAIDAAMGAVGAGGGE